MDRKRILIICLLMCLFVSLQAVTAADSDINGTSNEIATSTDGGNVKETDNVLASSPDSNVTLRAGNDGTFSELQEEINRGSPVINLEKNYTYDDGFTTTGILIDHDVTINGVGNIVLDANHKARIFDINNGILHGD